MTIEELLKERYEVVADYPNSEKLYKVGDIIEFNELYENSAFSKFNGRYCYSKMGHYLFQEHFDKYPHLFKQLAWWEKREASDMPEYAKATEWAYINGYKIEIGDILKVTYWEDNSAKTEYGTLFAQRLLPATLADYTAYTASKK